MQHLTRAAAAASCGARARQRRNARERFTAAEVVAIVVMALALIGAALSPALGRATDPAASPSAVTVPPNGTLWEIAAAHPVPGQTTAEIVQTIKDLNGLPDGAVLQPGQVLLVPSRLTESVVAQR